MKMPAILAALLMAYAAPGSAAGPGFSKIAYIHFSSPALVVTISDSSGRKAGVDPSLGINSKGQQIKNGAEWSLRDIPGSSVTQTNLDGSAVTSWEIDLKEPADRYELSVTSGMSVGSGTLRIDIADVLAGKSKTVVQSLVLQSGKAKALTLDLSGGAQVLHRTTVSPDELVSDVQSACALKAVGPQEACDSLLKLATAISKAAKKSDVSREANRLKIFLALLERIRYWGTGSEPKNWDGFLGENECDSLKDGSRNRPKTFIKDNVYRALKSDAEDLLKALPLRGRLSNDGKEDESTKHPNAR
jgi:hypothetical protein